MAALSPRRTYPQQYRTKRRGRVLSCLLTCVTLSLCDGSRAAFLSSRRRAAGFLSPRSSPSSVSTAARSTLASRSATVLFSGGEFATASGGGKEPSAYDGVDVMALRKYSMGLAAQMSLLFGFLTAIDAALGCFPSVRVPFAANVAFLYAFNVRSSVFSILPSPKTEGRKVTDEQKGTQEYNKRNIPKWTPPGIAFVLGWPLLTFGLRAITGAMVIQASGHRYATAAIMSLMLHFSVGNLWNTVNVERRLGGSVVLLYALWLTKAFAALQFYKVEPLAGKLLAVTLTWLTAAAALTTRTWQLNPDVDTGKLEPLVPMRHPRWSTKFRWEL